MLVRQESALMRASKPLKLLSFRFDRATMLRKFFAQFSHENRLLPLLNREAAIMALVIGERSPDAVARLKAIVDGSENVTKKRSWFGPSVATPKPATATTTPARESVVGDQTSTPGAGAERGVGERGSGDDTSTIAASELTTTAKESFGTMELCYARRSPAGRRYVSRDLLRVFTSHSDASALGPFGERDERVFTQPAGALRADARHFFVRVRWYGHEQSFVTPPLRCPANGEASAEQQQADMAAVTAVADDAWSLARRILEEQYVVDVLVDDSKAALYDPDCVIESAFRDASSPLPTELPIGSRLIRRSFHGTHDMIVETFDIDGVGPSTTTTTTPTTTPTTPPTTPPSA